MKRMIALAVACGMLLLGAGCTPNEMTVRMGEPADGTITVTGRAGVEAVPDIAVVTVGVVTQGSTSQQARAANATAMGGTLDAVTALGIAEEDMQTSGLNMWPYYGDSGNISGYRMSVDVTITVRDLDLLGQVIDAATDSGGSSLGGISFQLSNEDEVYEQALQDAVKLAREKAELLAAAAGKTVKEAQTITENSYGVVAYSEGASAKMNMDTGGGTRVMSGTTTVTAEVTATFTIE